MGGEVGEAKRENERRRWMDRVIGLRERWRNRLYVRMEK